MVAAPPWKDVNGNPPLSHTPSSTDEDMPEMEDAEQEDEVDHVWAALSGAFERPTDFPPALHDSPRSSAYSSSQDMEPVSDLLWGEDSERHVPPEPNNSSPLDGIDNLIAQANWNTQMVDEALAAARTALEQGQTSRGANQERALPPWRQAEEVPPDSPRATNLRSSHDMGSMCDLLWSDDGEPHDLPQQGNDSPLSGIGA